MYCPFQIIATIYFHTRKSLKSRYCINLPGIVWTTVPLSCKATKYSLAFRIPVSNYTVSGCGHITIGTTAIHPSIHRCFRFVIVAVFIHLFGWLNSLSHFMWICIPFWYQLSLHRFYFDIHPFIVTSILCIDTQHTLTHIYKIGSSKSIWDLHLPKSLWQI